MKPAQQVAASAAGSDTRWRADLGTWEREDDDKDRPPFKVLTRSEAQALIAKQPTVSPWRVVGVQGVTGMAVAAVMGLLWGERAMAFSALYGAAVVVVPGALMARGMTSRLSSLSPAGSTVSVMLWEMVKISASVALLALAPKVVKPLSWPALLVALAACLLVYGFALLWRGRKS